MTNPFSTMRRLGKSPVRLPAAPAKFAPDPYRRSLIGKVHVAKKELGLDDADYRAVLLDVTGKTSAGDCTEGELVKLIERFRARGFQAKPKRKPPSADHPVARKARALWISLHQLGAIEVASDQALESFAQRQLNVDRLQWANQAHGYKLIEALKAIAERHGWPQKPPAGLDADTRLLWLKRGLVAALLAKMVVAELIPADWTVDQAAASLLGMKRAGLGTAWSVSELDLIARGFAVKLRANAGGAE